MALTKALGGGGGGSGTVTTVKDEGSNLSTAVTSIDFVGAGVTATGTTAVTVTIPGGTSSSALLAAEIMADTPVGYWKCDDTSGTNLVDSSGNGLTLALTGTYTLAVDHLIRGDAATKFIRFGTSATSFASRSGSPITVPLSGDYTVEGIVRLGSLSATQALFTIMAATEVEADNYQLTLGATNTGAFRNFWEHGAGVNDEVLSGLTLTRLEPFHLVSVKDGTANTVTFYVNGVFFSTVSYSNEPTGGSNVSTYLGGNPSDNGFGGTIGHVALYNSKLSATRIAAHAVASGYF